MSVRYKDSTFHMMDAFNKNSKHALQQNFKKQPNEIWIRGKQGNTWDAKHMGNFLSRSNYSNWSDYSSGRDSRTHNKNTSTGDHFFRTTKDNKNQSKIGYTKINPLVSLVKTDKRNEQKVGQILQKSSRQRYCRPKQQMVKDGNFLYQSNSIKFRKTNPVTFQHSKDKNPSGYEKQRLLNLIQKRHPHGMTGIDHPDNPQAKYYQTMNLNTRIREQPNSHRTFFIDREWKSKGRVTDSYKKQYGYGKGNILQQRKFRNTNVHGYNIVNNCYTER